MFSKDLGDYKAESMDYGNTLCVAALVSGTWDDGVRIVGAFATPKTAKARRSIEATLIHHARTIAPDAPNGWYEIDTDHKRVRDRWADARLAAMESADSN